MNQLSPAISYAFSQALLTIFIPKTRQQQHRVRFFHHVAALSGGRAQMMCLPEIRSKGARAVGGFFIPGGGA
jgi:hypothetical protein